MRLAALSLIFVVMISACVQQGSIVRSEQNIAPSESELPDSWTLVETRQVTGEGRGFSYRLQNSPERLGATLMAASYDPLEKAIGTYAFYADGKNFDIDSEDAGIVDANCVGNISDKTYISVYCIKANVVVVSNVAPLQLGAAGVAGAAFDLSSAKNREHAVELAKSVVNKINLDA